MNGIFLFFFGFQWKYTKKTNKTVSWLNNTRVCIYVSTIINCFRSCTSKTEKLLDIHNVPSVCYKIVFIAFFTRFSEHTKVISLESI